MPYGAEVKIDIVDYTTETVSLTSHNIDSKIIPSQPPVSKSLDPDQVEFVYNETAYVTDMMKGSVPVSVEMVGMMRGRQLARITISPFR